MDKRSILKLSLKEKIGVKMTHLRKKENFKTLTGKKKKATQVLKIRENKRTKNSVHKLL